MRLMHATTAAQMRGIMAMLGTIIGAGVFGLPAMFVRVGLWPGTILYVLLSVLMVAVHLLYVDVILARREKMRLVGYARAELGRVGGWIAAISYPIQIIGVNILYILLGGAFLFILASKIGVGVASFFWVVLFWLAGSFVVRHGLRMVAAVEVFATWILVGCLVAVIGFVGTSVSAVGAPAAWGSFLAPFGIFLFSLSGLPVIPEIVDIVGRSRPRALRAVAIGTLCAAFLSWGFGALMAHVGGVGIGTGLEGMIGLLPGAWQWLLPLVGFLAVATSYLTTAEDLRATFHMDFALSDRMSAGIALVVPMFGLLLIRPDFLSLLDSLGTIFSTLSASLVAAMAAHVYARQTGRASGLRVLIPVAAAAAFVVALMQKFIEPL